ncbi:MAG TPA: saccharopine dehydrogenase [Trueperaceae bacterium]|nr:saccharopine dehydrogenase [Trueperaceae bacterium]
MKKILILGAGRSSSSAIRYLAINAASENWQISVADLDINLAKKQISGLDNCIAKELDISDTESLNLEISAHDIIISMLPAKFNFELIKTCISYKKNVLTPSYQTDEIFSLDSFAKENNVLVLNEMGLDPGIDHMSAMQILDNLRAKGALVKSFKSYTGGLVAPESDNNPWGYKFTWNPRNVILAGQGGAAKYLEDNQEKYIPYHKLFSRLEPIQVANTSYEGYANRNSLNYQNIYGLNNIQTLVRGTLRKKGFSAAWDCLVQLGMTDNSYTVNAKTLQEFTASFLPASDLSVKENLANYLKIDNKVIEKLAWLGLFEDIEIKQKNISPAKILQNLLEEKWALAKEDKDMIVMWHEMKYSLDAQEYRLESSLIVIGDDNVQTAMAKTVGYPIAIATKLILQGKLNITGVKLPVTKDIYQPILEELKDFGIEFEEKNYSNT